MARVDRRLREPRQMLDCLSNGRHLHLVLASKRGQDVKLGEVQERDERRRTRRRNVDERQIAAPANRPVADRGPRHREVVRRFGDRTGWKLASVGHFIAPRSAGPRTDTCAARPPPRADVARRSGLGKATRVREREGTHLREPPGPRPDRRRVQCTLPARDRTFHTRRPKQAKPRNGGNAPRGRLVSLEAAPGCARRPDAGDHACGA